MCFAFPHNARPKAAHIKTLNNWEVRVTKDRTEGVSIRQRLEGKKKLQKKLRKETAKVFLTKLPTYLTQRQPYKDSLHVVSVTR